MRGIDSADLHRCIENREQAAFVPSKPKDHSIQVAKSKLNKIVKKNNTFTDETYLHIRVKLYSENMFPGFLSHKSFHLAKEC